ncbi:uncharacterized protein LOC135395930 [Ornithodoros turicata]|uniref:uncharacterized protein LOC135395930 n=1 Tax=Ornithodoros turicata TaxID=34597 RepID=UPI00313924AB
MDPSATSQRQSASDHGDASASPIAAISAPGRLPDFWPNNVRLWFAQAESEFALKGIRSESTKYHMTIRALSERDISEVADIVANPPTDTPYQYLKQELLQRLQASTTQRLQRLLSTEELGDDKPSQLLRRLKALLADKASSFDEECLRELFLQRLPRSARSLLTVSQTTSLTELAALADQLTEDMSPSVAAVHSSHTHHAQPDLDSRLQALEKSLESLRLELRSDRSRRRSPSPRRIGSRPQGRTAAYRSPSPPPPESLLCWYHLKFGAAARQCRLPCQWAGNWSAAR